MTESPDYKIIDAGVHCPIDGKIIFSKKRAKLAAKLISIKHTSKDFDAFMHAYKGVCGFYHIGHNILEYKK